MKFYEVEIKFQQSWGKNKINTYKMNNKTYK